MSQGQTEAGREREAPRPVMLVGFQNQGNLGLGYLASVLRQHGHPVRVVDIEQDPETILQIALETGPVLVGFSLIFQFFVHRYAALLRMLRSRGVGCHFTMGGHCPTVSYTPLLGLIPELDSIVRFEGEVTLTELADAISAGTEWRGTRGIAYRGPDGIIATPARPLVEDLDQLPYPDRDYEPRAVLGRSMMPIVASRGCAKTCSFCSIHTFYRGAPGRIVRTRRPAEVVREMRVLHEERGITIFLFQDDDFPLVGPVWRRWAGEFVDELHRSGLPGKVIWKMNCRADSVERDLFVKLRDAGLYLVYMGLESGSEQSLSTLDKRVSVDQNLRAVSLLKDIGLMWEYGFMLLDPSSTFESVRDNLRFLRSILADGCLPVTFCRMLPYDGTPIRDELARAGRLLGDLSSPDYEFLDSRLSEFHEGLRSTVDLDAWIHGLEAVAQHLGCAWHEVAVIERLFPPLPGMRSYREELRRITRRSNDLLLDVVEDLSCVYSDGRESRWDPAVVEGGRRRVVCDLLDARDAFVFGHQDILLEALGIEMVASAADEPEATPPTAAP
jgi:anaerobic magnesium-protoporphyrin IX monomethyl ester cyclase